MKRADWTAGAQAVLAKIDDFYAEAAPEYADRVGDHWSAPATLYIRTGRPVRDMLQMLRVRYLSKDGQNEI